MDDNNLIETKIDSKEVYHGRLLHVYRDKISLPDGRLSDREIIRHTGAVCIVALNNDGNILIERQFRYPFNAVMTEIPAGKLDSLEEDPLSAAKRELKEETGYSADEWISLGIYLPTVAYSDEKIYIFLARGLHSGDRSLDEDEFINCSFVPFDEMVRKVMAGEIPDGKTQIGILKAAKWLEGIEKR